MSKFICTLLVAPVVLAQTPTPAPTPTPTPAPTATPTTADPTSAPTRKVTGANSAWTLTDSSDDVLASVTAQYPGDYYISKVIADTSADFYLGHIACPGPSVCPPSWIANDHCDDCFGCDQYMVATGFYGDCSTCDYFWSGGAVGLGTFDGGDCDDFVFPAAVNGKLLDVCLEGQGFRTSTQTASMSYIQKRNTIIHELELGGWANPAELQSHTDAQLAAKCEYANIKECLRTNGWYHADMSTWTDGDMKFKAAEMIDGFTTTYESIELVQMSYADILEQCVLAGIHQKMLGFVWETHSTIYALTGDEKRNYVIGKLSDSSRGKGTVTQLQQLHDTQLHYLLNYIDA